MAESNQLVQCRACGFFAKQIARPLTAHAERPYYEITRKERDKQIDLSPVTDQRLHTIPLRLACFRHAYDLRAEAEETDVEAVANKHRDCREWYPYKSGMSPSEHLEELRMLELEERRKAHDVKLFEMSQAVQRDSLKIAEASKDLVSDLKEIAQKSDKFSRRVTYLVILLALIQVLLAVAFYVFPRESYMDQLLRRIFGP